MKKIQTWLRSIALGALLVSGLGLGLVAVPAAPGYAAPGAVSPQSEACNAIGSGSDCKKSQGLKIDKVIRTIIDVLSAIIGIVAVVMIIIAGFKYITSGGDSNKVASAKNTIIYAVVGLILVALAQFIVIFVIKTST